MTKLFQLEEYTPSRNKVALIGTNRTVCVSGILCENFLPIRATIPKLLTKVCHTENDQDKAGWHQTDASVLTTMT